MVLEKLKRAMIAQFENEFYGYSDSHREMLMQLEVSDLADKLGRDASMANLSKYKF